MIRQQDGLKMGMTPANANTKSSVLATCMAILSLAVGLGQAVADDRPNIIVILADDLGYADTGFTGAKDIRTPNLDQLAESGVIFSHGYCNHPFCAPSRAALLSGRYQHRFGFEANPAYDPGNRHLGIDPKETLFPMRLQKVGYTTGIIGKWHLGAASPYHPCNRGFNYFYGFLGGGHDYFRIDTRLPLKNAYFQPLERNGQPAVFEGYLTQALSNDAVSFIESNKDNPFFLYLSYNAPHGPLQAPDKTIQEYSAIQDKKRRVYAAMVDEMDQGIGRVIATLEKQSLRDNTLVFFLSDHGGPIPMDWNPNYGNGSSNEPLRGGKTTFYEGGLRVPFVASWPGKIPAGVRFDPPIISIDIARTAVDVAGADATIGNLLEGKNLIPFLTGEKHGPPHEAIYWRGLNGKRWAVLKSDGTKLVADRAGQTSKGFQIYNDTKEEQDIKPNYPERFTSLRKSWLKWNKDNIDAKFENYIDYFEKREEFYLNSVMGQKQRPRKSENR